MVAPLPDGLERIVLLWIGRLGDVLVSTPFIAGLRRRFPKARILLVTGEAGAAGARLCGGVDEVRVLRRFHHPLQNASLAAELAGKTADLLVDLNSAFSRSAWVLARLARARIKAAFARGRGDESFQLLAPSPSETEHMIARYARLAAALGCSYEPELRITVPESDDAEAARLLREAGVAGGERPVLVHPGNFKKFDNRWPEEKFVALTDRLSSAGQARILYMAGPGEEEAVRGIVARLKRPVPVLWDPLESTCRHASLSIL